MLKSFINFFMYIFIMDKKINFKKQILVIHGGNVFEHKNDFYKYLKEKNLDPRLTYYDWKKNLKNDLSEDFEVFLLNMPNKDNADYQAWKIWFEKYFIFLNKNIPLILIGHSLGGIFLVKYLSENEISNFNISQLHLVASPFSNLNSLGNPLRNFSFNVEKLNLIENQVEKIFIYHSKDDFVVPFSHGINFSNIFKSSTFIKFENLGHINCEKVKEILDNINC